MPELFGRLQIRPLTIAIGLALALFVGNVVARSSFADPNSWQPTLAAFAPFALAAMASAPAIISGGGGIDISVGPLLNLVSIIIIVSFVGHGTDSALIVIPGALAIGLAIGALNGVLVTVLRYQPVIATLCGFFVFTGLGLEIASSPVQGTTPWLQHLAGGIGPVPGALFLIVPPLILWGLLGRTPYIRMLHAVGGDDATAFASGIDVAAVRIVAYALGGLFAAVGGIASAALLQTADPGLSTQYTLPAIAAVVLGGTPLIGGRGGLIGAFTGAACIFLVQTLLNSLQVNSAWNQVVYGALLIGALILSARLAALPMRRAA